MGQVPGPGDLGLADIRAASDAVVADLLRREEETLRRLGLSSHVDALKPLLLGAEGKRMRAVFCVWGWRGAGGSGSRTEVDLAAAALELNHSAFLIHDDILDRSELRRGQPATYRRFAGWHTAQKWEGSSDAFGDAVALMLGDLCLAWAGELIGRSADGDRLRRVHEVYHRMCADALYGQTLELQIQADRDFQPARCLMVTTYKAARYMLTPPLLIGAALADADDAVYAAYEHYGMALGEAYQLRDDLLGVFGDPDVTGKPNVDDLREGKPTVLFATACRKAIPARKNELLALYGDRGLDQAAADDLRHMLRETGALAVVEAMIRARAGEAARALRAAPIPDQARSALAALAERALFRTR